MNKISTVVSQETSLHNRTVVSDALEYYDLYQEKFEFFYKYVKDIRFEKAISETDHNKIIFYGDKDQILFKSRYENIGVYAQKGNVWTWAWSVPVFKKNSTYIIRKVLNYGIDITDNEFLKGELITSRFKISSKIQIDIHLAIASYLSKQQMVFIIKNTPQSQTPEFVKTVDFFSNSDDIYYFIFVLDYANLGINS